MEKVSFNLSGLLRRFGTGVKNVGRDFVTLKPAEQKVIDKFADASGKVHDIYGSKSRFNIWDFALPYKKSVIDHFWRNKWKFRPTWDNYAMYMKNHPKMGALKTAMGIAFPSSLPLTVTGLNMLDSATSSFAGDKEFAATDKGARTGLGARLTGGAVAGAIESSVPDWLKWSVPESIRRAGQAYNIANKYAPDQVEEARRYFNTFAKDTAKSGGKAILRSLNPLSNYTKANVKRSYNFLKDVNNRVSNAAAFSVGAATGMPSAVSRTDYLLQPKLDNRLKAEVAGVANGVLDDYVLQGKDIMDTLEDQLSLGINRSVLRDDIQKVNDKQLLRESMRTLRDENTSYLDKAKTIIPMFNRVLPGSYR